MFREAVLNQSSSSSGMYYYSGYNETYFRIVNVTELTKELTYFNRQYNGSFVAQVRNGILQVCPPGCIDCNCTGCYLGYTYDNSTGLCEKCPFGCLSCYRSFSNYSQLTCAYCNLGLYVYDYTTYKCDGYCDSNCLKCYSQPNSCSICTPGLSPTYNYTSYTYDCQACSANNCLTCSSYSGCTSCKEGFVISSINSYYSSATNSTCRKCSIYCSTCDRNDITSCSNCSKGL